MWESDNSLLVTHEYSYCKNIIVLIDLVEIITYIVQYVYYIIKTGCMVWFLWEIIYATIYLSRWTFQEPINNKSLKPLLWSNSYKNREGIKLVPVLASQRYNMYILKYKSGEFYVYMYFMAANLKQLVHAHVSIVGYCLIYLSRTAQIQKFLQSLE